MEFTYDDERFSFISFRIFQQSEASEYHHFDGGLFSSKVDQSHDVGIGTR